MNKNQRAHGVPGQLSVLVLDKDSDYTNFGRHNRIVVFKDRLSEEIQLREDDIGLGWSTEEQRQKVACKTFQRQHPSQTRLTLKDTQEGKVLNCESRWYSYQIEAVHRLMATRGAASCAF